MKKPIILPIPSIPCLHAIYAHFAERATQHMVTSGEVQPQVFFLYVPSGAQKPSSMAAMDPASTHHFFASPDGRGALGQLIRQLFDPIADVHSELVSSLPFQPNLVVVLSEVWYVEGGKDETAKQALNDIVSSGLPVSEHPDRREAISIQFYSERGMLVGLLPVTRHDPEPATVEFQHLIVDMKASGRLAMHDEDDDAPPQTIH